MSCYLAALKTFYNKMFTMSYVDCVVRKVQMAFVLEISRALNDELIFMCVAAATGFGHNPLSFRRRSRQRRLKYGKFWAMLWR